MTGFRKLSGHQRSPAGLEWRIWRRLHWIWLAGTALPLAAAAVAYGLSLGAASPNADRAVEQFFYVALGWMSLHWTLVLGLAIGCGIVIVMKGPAYAADALPGQEMPPGTSPH